MSNKGYGVETDLSIFTDTMVEMTWQEVDKAAKDGDIILLPVGIVEEHGPHLDLSPDIYMAYHFCKYLKHNLEEKEIGALIAPPFYWGVSEEVKSYPGTFSVRPETMKALLMDIFHSLESWGFRKIFIVNAHGDQTHVRMIDEAAEQMSRNSEMSVFNLGNFEVELDNPPEFPKQREGRFEPDYHAGAIESAAVFTFYPNKGNRELAKQLKPQDTFHPLGYCGDPASFELEDTIIDYFHADVETDASKIEAYLKAHA
ncbi:MAG: Creatininase [Firmicutes bacterium]|nr:Creatininase [Bacillota bacterium]